MILGDNGNIYRIVGTDGNNDIRFLNFQYDTGTGLRVYVRAIETLDYTPGGADSDIGAADEIHGEAGDDFIHGMGGDDILYGDAQDDNLIGGVGNDWISGGTGEDGVLGDDGKIFTSRNGVAEPLYGIEATTQGVAATKGGFRLEATTNEEGKLKEVG